MSMKEGWVYLLRERDFLTGKNDRYLKIGLTERDVHERVKEHQTGNAREILSIYEKHVPLMSSMEKHLHHVFSTDRIYGEWFDIDDSRVQTELIPMIERLSNEQIQAKVNMEKVSELKNIYDNGNIRNPTKAEETLHKAYLNAKHAHILAKANHAIADAKIRALIGTYESLSGVAIVKSKSQSNHFDKKSFLASLSEQEQEKCHETVTEFKSGSVKIIGTLTLKKLDPTLDERKKNAESTITNPPTLANIGGGEAQRTKEMEQAHSEYLASRRSVKETEWEEQRLAAALAVAIGEDREITGVCSWIREDVTTENKWSSELAKTNFPTKYAAHTLERPDIVEVKIAEFHAY
jgi:hypothetical protein